MKKISFINAISLIAILMVLISASGESGVIGFIPPDELVLPQVTHHVGSDSKQRLALQGKSLDKIYAEYKALPKTAVNVEKLYQLHLKLKSIRDEIVKFDSGLNLYNSNYKKYEELGLSIGAFSETLEYSDDLLIEIQTIDPNSRYREEARYALMSKGREYGGPADVETLKEYVKNFPSGKYSSRIYYDLGNYYFGLYKYLRYAHDSDNDRSSCYNQNSSRSVDDLLKEAQAAGIASYKKAFDLELDGSMRNAIKLSLRALLSGENTETDAWCDMAD